MSTIDPLFDAPIPNLPNAACKGVEHADVFFPRQRDMNHALAKAQANTMCDGCPERIPCLEWALTNGALGIWAGTDESDRKKLLKGKASA